VTAATDSLKVLPEPHTDFKLGVSVEWPDVFAFLAIAALVGFVIWWFFVRRR